MDKKELSEMSKEIRQELKISQHKLADLLETNQTKVSFIEGGFTPPQRELQEKIMKLYEEICS